MNHTLYAVTVFSNVLAGIIGVIRFKKINSTYFPFLFFICVGIANDTFSWVLIQTKQHTTVNNNIYVLVESIILLWLFTTQRLLKNNKTVLFLMILCVGVWLTEAIVKSLNQVFVYFRIFYSFLIVLLSINMINTLLMAEKRSIFKNASFLICIAFIMYFTMKALIYAFWVYGLTKSLDFLKNIQIIMITINFLTNLIYTLAVLWIPKKQLSILPS